METVRDFIFLGSKITEDSDFMHRIKRCLLLGTKAMRNLGSVLKKQRSHFANKGPCSQSYDFFQQSCMDVRFGPQRGLIAEELMLSNCGIGEDS